MLETCSIKMKVMKRERASIFTRNLSRQLKKVPDANVTQRAHSSLPCNWLTEHHLHSFSYTSPSMPIQRFPRIIRANSESSKSCFDEKWEHLVLVHIIWLSALKFQNELSSYTSEIYSVILNTTLNWQLCPSHSGLGVDQSKKSPRSLKVTSSSMRPTDHHLHQGNSGPWQWTGPETYQGRKSLT